MPPNPAKTPPWYANPRPVPGQRVVVVGSGLAGSAVAASLAARGCNVEVLEAGSQPGGGASANPVAILQPYLTADHSAVSRYHCAGYEWTLARLQQLSCVQGAYGEQAGAGLFRLAVDPASREKTQRLVDSQLFSSKLFVARSSEEISRASGMPTAYSGLEFPNGGWVNPASLCRALLKSQRNIQLSLNQPVGQIRPQPEGWALYDPSGELLLRTEVLVIATGEQGGPVANDNLPLVAVRGQTTAVRMPPGLLKPGRVLAGHGFVTPEIDGLHYFGATYDRGSIDPKAGIEGQQQNLSRLKVLCPPFAALKREDVVSNWVGFRATTPDRLPLVGPAPDWQFYQTHYGDLQHGRGPERYPEARYQTGLYLSLGHGSRGLCSSLLAGELLAGQITGVQLSPDQWLLEGLHPARFLIRALRRR